MVTKKKSRNSGHTPKHFGDGKVRSYCPHCPPAIAGRPDAVPHVPIGAKLPKQAVCKNGHTWVPVRG